jgi:hypothetical protein
MIQSVSAVTLATHNMSRAVAFYRMLGFEIVHGGDDASVIAADYRPDTAPRDAKWGERFFHLTDPDGHELSFAWPSQ